MSGASVHARPRIIASNSRGGSNSLSLASTTLSPSSTRVSAPSPSTRASTSTLIVLLAMALGLLAERRRRGVERLEQPADLAARRAERDQLIGERPGARRVARAEAAVAAARVARAQRAAAVVGHRPQAWRAVRDHDADVAAQLALDAHRVMGNIGLAAV